MRPSAESPARSSADLTCALATGSRASAPLSRRPTIATGAKRPSSRPTTCAPIARSGSTTRPIGRRRSDASPVSTENIGRPANNPVNRRRLVPELPQSSTSSGSRSASTPAPRRRSAGRPSDDVSSIAHPIARSAATVRRQSSDAKYPLTMVSPCAIPPRITAPLCRANHETCRAPSRRRRPRLPPS